MRQDFQKQAKESRNLIAGTVANPGLEKIITNRSNSVKKGEISIESSISPVKTEPKKIRNPVKNTEKKAHETRAKFFEDAEKMYKRELELLGLKIKNKNVKFRQTLKKIK